jgi:hypothetical protein
MERALTWRKSSRSGGNGNCVKFAIRSRIDGNQATNRGAR